MIASGRATRRPPLVSAPRAANIGPAGRRRRLAIGLGALALGLAALLALLVVDAARAWRVVLVVPFWVGALGLAQARRYT